MTTLSRIRCTLSNAQAAARYIARDEAAGYRRWFPDGAAYGPAESAEVVLRGLRSSRVAGRAYARRLALARRLITR